jgi:DNA-binding NtrC family response regulator
LSISNIEQIWLEQQLREKEQLALELEHILGDSPKQLRQIRTIIRTALFDSPVFISGERGTGKTNFSDILQRLSNRRKNKYAKINCGAIAPELAQSELMGHGKGGFTGAHGERLGLFRYADHGTVFLDEVAELKKEIQVMLLRVLNEGVVKPVGYDKEVPVDVRIITATNEDLRAKADSGDFSQPLYDRIIQQEIKIPPLREKNDAAFDYYVNRAAQRVAHLRNGELTDVELNFADEAVRQLRKNGYEFYGNVRELFTIYSNAATYSHDYTIREFIEDHVDEQLAQRVDLGEEPVGIPLSKQVTIFEEKLREAPLFSASENNNPEAKIQDHTGEPIAVTKAASDEVAQVLPVEIKLRTPKGEINQVDSDANEPLDANNTSVFAFEDILKKYCGIDTGDEQVFRKIALAAEPKGGLTAFMAEYPFDARAKQNLIKFLLNYARDNLISQIVFAKTFHVGITKLRNWQNDFGIRLVSSESEKLTPDSLRNLLEASQYDLNACLSVLKIQPTHFDRVLQKHGFETFYVESAWAQARFNQNEIAFIEHGFGVELCHNDKSTAAVVLTKLTLAGSYDELLSSLGVLPQERSLLELILLKSFIRLKFSQKKGASALKIGIERFQSWVRKNNLKYPMFKKTLILNEKTKK